jgi:hypothetical protein
LRLREVGGPLPDCEADAFDRFEAEFTYPLGPSRRFRVSHERDPHRFFEAMGEAVTFIAEDGGRVAGSASIAIRRLLVPDGAERSAAYIGDLKVAPLARGGRALLRLTRALEGWGRRHTDAAFSIVMDGTALTPLDYTGRAGIPAFETLAKVVLFRIPTAGATRSRSKALESNPDEVLSLFRRRSRGRIGVVPGDPGRRSITRPIWLVTPGGQACGCVEDTRRAKRLLADDGSEIASAHLTAFAFATPRDGATLVHAACQKAGEMKLDALFVPASDIDAAPLRDALGPMEAVEAPATIYGAGLPRGQAWNINTSEI